MYISKFWASLDIELNIKGFWWMHAETSSVDVYTFLDCMHVVEYLMT